MKYIFLTLLTALSFSIGYIPEEYHNYPMLGGNDIGNGKPMANNFITIDGEGNDIGNGRGTKT